MTDRRQQCRELIGRLLNRGDEPAEISATAERMLGKVDATLLLDGTLTGPQRDAAIVMFRRKLIEGRTPESLRKAGEAQLGLVGWREVVGPASPNPRPPAVPPPVPLRAKPAGGVGTELHSLLAELGIVPRYGCGCQNLAAECDRNGVAWAEENLPIIAAKLRENAAKASWRDKLTAGLKAVTSGLAFRLDPSRLYESLVEEAIRRAKEKQLKDTL